MRKSISFLVLFLVLGCGKSQVGERTQETPGELPVSKVIPENDTAELELLRFTSESGNSDAWKIFGPRITVKMKNLRCLRIPNGHHLIASDGRHELVAKLEAKIEAALRVGSEAMKSPITNSCEVSKDTDGKRLQGSLTCKKLSRDKVAYDITFRFNCALAMH